MITGASGGIGKATAEMLAKEGWNLYLHYHQNEAAIKELLSICRQFGAEAIPMRIVIYIKLLDYYGKKQTIKSSNLLLWG